MPIRFGKGKPKQLSSKEAATLRRNLANAQQLSAEEYLARSALIYEVWVGLVGGKRPVWEHWGFSSFADFSERELNMSVRSANYMCRAWHVFGVELKGRWDRSLLLTSSKMAKLSHIVNASDVNEWLRRGKKLTHEELCREMRKAQGRPLSSNFRVILSKSDAVVVERALNLLRREFPEDTRGGLMARMASEWLQTQVPVLKKKAS